MLTSYRLDNPTLTMVTKNAPARMDTGALVWGNVKNVIIHPINYIVALSLPKRQKSLGGTLSYVVRACIRTNEIEQNQFGRYSPVSGFSCRSVQCGRSPASWPRQTRRCRKDRCVQHRRLPTGKPYVGRL
jgi:hypothetical protein